MKQRRLIECLNGDSYERAHCSGRKVSMEAAGRITMQFTRQGSLYRVSRITGPHHNLLGLSICADPPGESFVVVEPLPTTSKPQSQGCLDAAKVRDMVLNGVRAANVELGTTFYVSRIHFIPTDSEPYEVYSMMSKAIIQRIATGGEFLAGGK